jgi:DNA-binding CsgD family transcriptional regulator
MTMLAGEREPLNSDFYVKWVKPLGFRDVIGVLVNGHHPDRRSGGISYMNSSAESFLKAGTALKSKDGRLVAARAGARDALSHALAQSVAGNAPSTTGQHAVALPDEEGSGLIANVLPLEWRDGRNPLASLPGVAAVIIQNPVDFAAPPMEAFAGLYGLSSAERKVLEHIADGKPPQETADHLGISVNTVKTHLQKIFAKTNTGRQADLIHLVTRSTAPLKAKQQPTD